MFVDISPYSLEFPQPLEFRSFLSLDRKFVSVTSPELRTASCDLERIGEIALQKRDSGSLD